MSPKQLITDNNNPLKRKTVDPLDIYRVPDQELIDRKSARSAHPEHSQTAQAPEQDAIIQYGTYLPRALVKQLKRYAFDNEIPAAQVVQSAVDEYLKNHRKS